jgi:hypothetical protein
LADKRVQDVSGDYESGNQPAGDADIRRIRRQATALTTGKLERDVDEVLRAKGVRMDEPLGEKSLRKASAGRVLRRRKA